MGEIFFSCERKMWFLVNCNIVKFYGSVTLEFEGKSPEQIMAYLHFSELNSLQSQYHLFYILLLMFIRGEI